MLSLVSIILYNTIVFFLVDYNNILCWFMLRSSAKPSACTFGISVFSDTHTEAARCITCGVGLGTLLKKFCTKKTFCVGKPAQHEVMAEQQASVTSVQKISPADLVCHVRCMPLLHAHCTYLTHTHTL